MYVRPAQPARLVAVPDKAGRAVGTNLTLGRIQPEANY